MDYASHLYKPDELGSLLFRHTRVFNSTYPCKQEIDGQPVRAVLLVYSTTVLL